MSATTLGMVVLLFYLGMAILGWLIAFAALGVSRYFPVLSLMGMGGGVPALGLFIIRLGRLFGFASGANDINAQVVLLVSFAFAVFCWSQALHLAIKERLYVNAAYGKRVAIRQDRDRLGRRVTQLETERDERVTIEAHHAEAMLEMVHNTEVSTEARDKSDESVRILRIEQAEWRSGEQRGKA